MEDVPKVTSAAPHRRLPPLLSPRARRGLLSLLIVVAVVALYLFVLTRGALP